MMKRLLLLGLAFSASVGAANAQAYGEKIGSSSYDLQTNSATANRLVQHPDGTISAMWTENCDLNDATHATRGLGYNYFDGTSWVEGDNGTCPDQYGIASKRTGWPEVVALPNGNEVVFSHDGNGINMTRRATKGTGSWGQTTDLSFTQNITSVVDINGTTVPVTGYSGGGNGTWPRAVSSGNTIHLIYTVNTSDPQTDPEQVQHVSINGVRSAFVYSRSSDGGQTWDIQNMVLPGLENAIKGYPNRTPAIPPTIGGDSYALAALGGYVAVVTGDFGDNWTLFKSTDFGNTWTDTPIRDGFSPEDTIMINRGSGDFDTLAYSNDASHAVAIDYGGTVHVWGGQLLISVTGSPLAATGTYYPLAGDGILYWNDDFMQTEGPALIAVTEDLYPEGDPNDFIADGSSYNPQRWTSYGTRSFTSMPNAAVDSNTGDLYVVYSGVVEGTSDDLTPGGRPFRDLYVVHGERVGNGIVWHRTINIAREFESIPDDTIGTIYDEETYPAVNRMIGADGKLHIMYQHSFEPGLHVNGDMNNIGENAMAYVSYNIADINAVYANDTAAVLAVNDNLEKYINEISAYPNPTVNKVTLNINLKQSADVAVKIFNVMGQEVKSIPAKNMAAGNLNTVEVEMANLVSGVYYFTITSDDFTVTHRVVKQ